MMTMANLTLPLVGLIFIGIATFYIVAVVRNNSKTNSGINIANKVRIRLAVIFIIVGIVLFSFYAYIR